MSNSQNKSHLILVVDDTLKNIQVIGSTLRKEGYRIAIATNGEEAINTAQEELPSLILMDVMMPQMDGFQATKILKKDPQTKYIPVIFLTAKVDQDDILQGFKAGGVDYLSKPFHPKELLARIATQIELVQSREEIQDKSRELKELLHILGHDLSNSLNCMKSLLIESNDPERLFEWRDPILKATDNSLDIVNMIRTMRALDENKIQIALESINLEQCVENSTGILWEMIQTKGIQLELDLEPGVNLMAERVSFINSVLNNLLTNAIKFSYPSGVIRIQSKKVGELAQIIIQDEGIGMNPRLVNDLFDLTKLTHRPGTKGENGIGYGLPLVKKFIDLYGGEIEVTSLDERESPQTHGTTFHIHLPLAT